MDREAAICWRVLNAPWVLVLTTRSPGYVIRVASKAELVETKHVVKVTVGFSKEVQKDYLSRNAGKELRPGAEVRARIDCGQARLAYVLLRDVVHVFYETVLFRWPFLR